MTTRWRMAVMAGLVLVSAGVLWAEDITLSTYYPSPRGMFDQLRTNGDVYVGSLNAPVARLHVLKPDAGAAFRVDDEAADTTPFLIDGNGNVSIGTTAPGQKLSVNGIIESIAGGVKFPDGTIQTTAAQYPFGGMFSVLTDGVTCNSTNPYTGGCSCPAGYTDRNLGFSGVGGRFYHWCSQ